MMQHTKLRAPTPATISVAAGRTEFCLGRAATIALPMQDSDEPMSVQQIESLGRG